MAFNDFVFICFLYALALVASIFQNKNLFDSLNILCYCPLSLSSLTAFLFLKLYTSIKPLRKTAAELSYLPVSWSGDG